MSTLGNNMDDQFGQNAALTKLKLDSRALNDVVSLDHVYESIQNELDSVYQYREKLKSYSKPTVSGNWYRLGGVGADQINSALSSVVRHVREGFNLISNTERNQSENLKNICLLIGLLAVAEGKLYAQFAELTADSVKTSDILKDLEEDLNEIASNEDSAEENIKKIAQVMANILEEKNKQVLAFKNTLIKNRQDTDNAISLLRDDLDAFKSSLGGRMDDVEKKAAEQLAEAEKRLTAGISDARTAAETKATEQLSEVEKGINDKILQTQQSVMGSIKESSESTRDKIEKTDHSLHRKIVLSYIIGGVGIICSAVTLVLSLLHII